MLDAIGGTGSQAFHAEMAYDLRAFAKQKRYTMQEITAFVVHPMHPHRAEVEAFIHQVFYHAYGANVTHFMPTLIALRNAQHELVAAFGMREAKTGSLFLEQYLDAPIEQVISTGLGQNIQRKEITEIGNLAVANPRNAGILIAHVIQQSLDMGVKWCVATTHHSLQNGLIKGGRDVYPLALADKMRLSPEEQALWGRYYDNLPQVVAVRGVA